MRSRNGLGYSLVLHAIVLALVIFGLPAFFEAKREAEPVVISVELLPVTGITNVKPASRKVEEEPTPPKEEPKPVEKPEEAKPETPKPSAAATAAPTPPPPPKETVKEEAPKEKTPEKPKDEPKPKPAPPKEEKPKEKKPEEDLDSILKSVAKAAKSEAKESPKSESKKEAAAPAKEVSDSHNNSTNYNPDLPLSMSERDAIMSQIARCWSVPAGAKDAYTLVVTLSVQLNQDGSLVAVALAKDQGRYGSDPFFRAAADSAIRAVKRCSPLKSLPPEKYGTWKDLELNFDPKDALY